VVGRRTTTDLERRRARLVGVEIGKQRNDANLTQEELARRSHVATSTLRKVEAGATVNPGVFTMVSICAALSLDLGEFLASIEVASEK
jgi:transcriptional regulator with XRE-family HTH domain